MIMIGSSLAASSLSSVSASFTAKTSSVKRTGRVIRASVVARAKRSSLRRRVKTRRPEVCAKCLRRLRSSEVCLRPPRSKRRSLNKPRRCRSEIRLGDIEVWQFLVLTAGYFIGIEIYLDRKYDDKNKPVMPTVQKKEDVADEAKEE